MNTSPASELLKSASLSLPKLLELPLVFYSAGSSPKLSPPVEGKPAESKVSITASGIKHSFDSLIYAEEIRLVPIEGTSNTEDLEFEITKTNGEKIIVPADPNTDEPMTFAIRDFISGFAVRNSKILSWFTPKIAGVMVGSWSMEQLRGHAHALSDVSKKLKEAERLTNNSELDIKKREETLAKRTSELDSSNARTEAGFKEREAKIAEKESNSKATLETTKKAVESLESEKSKLTTEVAQLKTDATALDGNIKTSEEKVDSASKAVAELENRSALLNSEIKSKSTESAELSDKLRALQRDTTTYAEDMKGLGQEIRMQSIVYAIIVIAAAIGVAQLGLHVAAVSDQITSEYLKNQNLKVWSLIGLRGSFMVIAGSALGFLVYVCRFSIGQIAGMFAHRRAMVTIGIFAREYTNSAAHGLKLTDAEIFAARMEMRKSLIVDQMSGKLRPRSKDITPSLEKNQTDESENDESDST